MPYPFSLDPSFFAPLPRPYSHVYYAQHVHALLGTCEPGQLICRCLSIVSPHLSSPQAPILRVASRARAFSCRRQQLFAQPHPQGPRQPLARSQSRSLIKPVSRRITFEISTKPFGKCLPPLRAGATHAERASRFRNAEPLADQTYRIQVRRSPVGTEHVARAVRTRLHHRTNCPDHWGAVGGQPARARDVYNIDISTMLENVQREEHVAREHVALLPERARGRYQLRPLRLSLGPPSHHQPA